MSYTGMLTQLFENAEQYIHGQDQRSYVFISILIFRIMQSIM